MLFTEFNVAMSCHEKFSHLQVGTCQIVVVTVQNVLPRPLANQETSSDSEHNADCDHVLDLVISIFFFLDEEKSPHLLVMS